MSDALGALVGGLFGLGSSAMQYGMQRNLMKYQAELNYKYGKKATLNQYGWQRQGLEKAGYNPLLALGGAEGVANTGWTSAQSAPNVDPLSSALSVLENKRQTKLNNANVNNINTDTQTKYANMGLIAQQIVGQQLENAFYSRQKESEIALSNAEQFYKLAIMQESLERTKWIGPTAKAQIDSMFDQAKASLVQSGASVTSAKAQSTMAGANAEEQRLRAKWIKEHPYLYGIERAGAGFAAMAGAGIGAGYGIKSMINKKNPVGFRTK